MKRWILIAVLLLIILNLLAGRIFAMALLAGLEWFFGQVRRIL